MKILLAEYTTTRDPVLAPEGAAMLAVLKTSFEHCGHTVIQPGPGDFGVEIERLAPSCDMGLVIAPDNLLSKYTMVLEQHTHNLGCGFISAALCANKVLSAHVLKSHGIPVPDKTPNGRHVIKPVNGCGAQDIRLSASVPGKGEFSQDYIDGGHYSVSLVASRVVGEACLYFSGNPPLVLAVNRQIIDITKDGLFCYRGGETPVHPEREPELLETAQKAISVLGCQGYCGVDIVLADKPYIVDINPRITTSLIGIAACMNEEIAEILIAASKGEAIEPVHLSGSALFDTQGKVTRL
jgi:hypothetical protein